ncbi:MAG: hypothetical protein P4L64_09030 [Caulobacteraceae bacterium]|nr:hypothetical protein [Caulobacteraceae bacterium]
MTQQPSSDICPEPQLLAAVETVRRDETQGLTQIDHLLNAYPMDPRLQFLRGSILAGLKRYEEAHAAMARAVAIAPLFAVARFQLGFLELSSGQASAALATWAPLQDLPPEDPLRVFAIGLGHLIRDEFGPAIETLRAGIALNTQNLPINHDMQLIIDKALEAVAAQDAQSEPISSAHLLLQQYTSPSTKH